MRKTVVILAVVFLTLIVVPGAIPQAPPQANPYPAMAPLAAYLMPKDAEIALARSAAPASIADGATVMVLGRQGYSIAVPGTNGFLCYVERSWARMPSHPEFWNPKMRAPNCFNPAAAKSVTQIYRMKTRLVLAGESKAEIEKAVAAAMEEKKLTSLAPSAMCYMMSKQQYLSDRDKNWRPHLMFYVAGDVASSWGANLPGSPMLASYDPESKVTVFMVVAGHWSDGTPDPR